MSWREVHEYEVEVTTDTFRGTYLAEGVDEVVAVVDALEQFGLQRPNEPTAGLRVEVRGGG